MKHDTKFKKLLASYDAKNWKTEIKEWTKLAVSWLSDNGMKITEDKVLIAEFDTITEHKAFANVLSASHLGLTVAICNSKNHYVPKYICVCVDKFHNCTKAKKAMIDLCAVKDTHSRLLFFEVPVAILFHELGHWVMFKYLAHDNRKRRTAKAAAVFNKYTQLAQKGDFHERAADWFVLYAFNPQHVLAVAPTIYSFFKDECKIAPMI